VGACPFCLDTRRESPEVDKALQSDAPCCSQVVAIEQIRHVPRTACPYRSNEPRKMAPIRYSLSAEPEVGSPARFR
jgi:hypothetical protein